MAIDNPSNLMPDQEIIIEGDAGFVPKASPSDAGKVLGVLNASGDVGWVVDQSGTFIQVQADWAETDSSQPSYIDNKPDLSVYATASSVETALAGKQDTISDLSEIRAGAAKGDTAVQPSALDDYATTSAMNTALAGKQDTISDLATIRSGAQAGATAVQPSTLESYATTSAMNTALSGKQDTISDLAAIRAGAQAGSTAVQPATLESYATTSAMNTALAGKQDVINDLSDIRSGAASGATAVQPSALESYATTSAMNTALAGKQDVINDLATIRSGAAAGATAAQPSDLPSSDELVPSATSVDAGKVLTVGNDGTASWVTPSAGTVYTPGDGIDITSDVISADVDGVTIGIDSTTKKIKSLQTIPSVDQTYSASSTNAQSGTAVAGAIAGVKQVPASTSADQNKVLTVNSSGNAVWQNAQTTSYTAGKGVKIANNEISADLEVVQPCLTFGSDFKFDGATQYRATLSNNTRVSVPYNTACKFTLPGNLPSTVQTGMNGGTLTLQIVDSNSTVIQTLKSKYYSGSYLNIPIPQDFYKDVDIPAISVNNCYLRWTWFKTSTTELTVSNFDSTAYCFVVPYSGTLALVSPLPASTSSDANKVLTVDSNGAAGWQTPSTVTVDQTYNASSTNAQSGVAVAQAIASIPSSSYTAGDGIAIESGEISVDYDSNTLQGVASTTTVSVSQVDEHSGFSLPEDLQQMQTQSDTVNVTIHIPANTFKYTGYFDESETFVFTICQGLSSRGANPYLNAPLSYTAVSSSEYWINEQNIVITMPTLQANGWKYDTNLSVKEYFNIVTSAGMFFLTAISNDGVLASPITFTYSGGSHEVLTVKNPLPASAQADSGKILKVNASGNAEWGPDGFTTTAGITDIQQVAALPANPVATVLYLIPET